MEKHVMLGIGWVLYYFLHSLFASDKIKVGLTQNEENKQKFYRLIYNLIFTIGLFYLLKESFFMKSPNLSESLPVQFSMLGFWVGLAFMVSGLGVIKVTFNTFSLKSFMGLETDKQEGFKKDGVLKYVRHPLYAGTILFLGGLWLAFPTVANLITFLMATLYIFIGIRLEENKLTKAFGQEYIRYKEQTPMLIPRLKR